MKRFVSSLAVIAFMGLSAVTSAAPAEYYYTIGAHCCHEELTDVVMPKIMDSRVDSVVNDTVTDVAMRHFGFLSEDSSVYDDKSLHGVDRLENAMKVQSEDLKKRTDELTIEGMKCSYNSDYALYTYTDDLLSYVQTTDVFLGGAHGTRLVTPATIDMNTGKLLHLKDLFAQHPDWEKKFQKDVDKMVKALIDDGKVLKDTKVKLTGEETYLHVINRKDGKDTYVVMYSEDEILPHAAGVISFGITP